MAEQQHGVVSRVQLRDLGLRDHSIATAVAAGHLHPVFRGVFAVGHMPASQRARMHAATLACGEGTVVSHRSAAALLGLQDRSPAVVEVIAPMQAGRGIDGIRRHFSPPPRGDEAGTYESIPCTSPSRTLVDLAGVLSEASMRRVAERAAVLRILDACAVEAILNSARRRGAPALRRVLRDWQVTSVDPGGPTANRREAHVRSDLEARLLALVRAAALPKPLCNHAIVADGKRIEVDFLWPKERLIVETDGRRFHDNPIAFERDRFRDRALHLAGYRVIRFTFEQIRGEPDAVVTAIRRLLTDKR